MTSPAPLVVAHRGGCGLAPENTLAAFRSLADEDAVDAVEFDVQLTADGQLVVFHDETLERTTDIASVFPERAAAPVSSLRSEELRRLDAGSWFSARFAGERIPELDAVLDALDPRLAIYLELKTPDPQLVERLPDAVAAWSDRELSFWSFHADALAALRSRLPEHPFGLFVRSSEAGIDARALDGLAYVNFWPYARAHELAAAERAGVTVAATANGDRELRAAERRVSVVTDYPRYARDFYRGAVMPAPSLAIRVDGAVAVCILRAGDGGFDCRGAVLRHDADTPLPATLLAPGERIEIPFRLGTRARRWHAGRPAALIDGDGRVVRVTDY